MLEKYINYFGAFIMIITETIETKEYQTLDKDYGRAWIVGSGYGELDPEQYKLLEELAK